jgi:hypothetical protein
MNKIHYILFQIILFTFTLFAQGTAGEKAKYEYRYIIDMPTAGIIEKGVVGVTTDFLPNGVLIEWIEAGVFENVSIGISYGGSNFIGSGKIDWYKWPGITFRARVLNETVFIPAITLGFDAQGKGEYFDDDERYAIKSPGFFGAVSKNFELLGYLSLHAETNYSLEGNDGDNYVDFRVGFEKTLGSSFSLVAEYDFAFNDNNSGFGIGRGYLNAGIRWSPGPGFTVGFDLRDLLDNEPSVNNGVGRAFRIEYLKNIF